VIAARPFNRIQIVSGLLVLVALGFTAITLKAQLEGSDRGIAPIDSASSYEIGGVAVDVVAKDPEQARQAGWRLAQRKGWKMLWARMNGGNENSAPGLSDSTLGSIVGGIVIEQEQIGPHRYIAKLGVLFDRARAGQLLGGHGQSLRSPPMLVIPVQISGGTPTSFELRNPWQAAWARFRTGGSPIDYVRPTGTGADSLLLNQAQSHRPGRGWWRMLLDQYGASDILIPEVIIERQWPGGPVIGRFAARHGPDNRLLGRFALRAPNGDGLEALLDEGIRRIDGIYATALRNGELHADPTLVIEDEEPAEGDDLLTLDDIVEDVVSSTPGGTIVTVQVDTPDAAALSAAEAALRETPGVRSSDTTSLALGGLSVIRVNFSGDINLLTAALTARGWRVEAGTDVLRIRRAPAAPAVAPQQP
jgi:hypothetical protein